MNWPAPEPDSHGACVTCGQWRPLLTPIEVEFETERTARRQPVPRATTVQPPRVVGYCVACWGDQLWASFRRIARNEPARLASQTPKQRAETLEWLRLVAKHMVARRDDIPWAPPPQEVDEFIAQYGTPSSDSPAA